MYVYVHAYVGQSSAVLSRPSTQIKSNVQYAHYCDVMTYPYPHTFVVGKSPWHHFYPYYIMSKIGQQKEQNLENYYHAHLPIKLYNTSHFWKVISAIMFTVQRCFSLRGPNSSYVHAFFMDLLLCVPLKGINLIVMKGREISSVCNFNFTGLYLFNSYVHQSNQHLQ